MKCFSLDLYIGKTFANFSSFGKSPCTIDKLMRCVRGITYSLVNCFVIDGGRQSCPGALLFNWEITVFTQFSVQQFLKCSDYYNLYMTTGHL